jgi:hypothetical protein
MINGLQSVGLYRNTKSVGVFSPSTFYTPPDATIATSANTSNTTASSFRSGSDISAFFSSGYNIFATTYIGEYLQVYFPAYTKVTTVTYRNAIAASWAPTSVKIQSSIDGLTWVDEALYIDDASTNIQTINVATNTLARYWRFYQNSNTRQNSSGYEWHFGNFTMTGLAIPTSENDKYSINPYNPVVIHPEFFPVLYSSVPIITDSLILHLDVAKRQSYPTTGTTWFDLAGSSHGSLKNGVAFTRDNYGALVFNGINTSVTFPGSALSLNTMTISSWNFSTNYIQNGFMFEKTTNGAVNTQYSLFYNQGNSSIYFRTYGLGTTDLLVGTLAAGVKNGKWNNVVATYDLSSKKIYVNGVLAATQSVTGTVTQNNTGIAYIGLHGTPHSYPFNGRIAHTTLYSRALTQAEIQYNFNTLKGRYNL